MELVLGIIAVIAAIALMPAIAIAGFTIVTVLISVGLWVVMMPFAWAISAIEKFKSRKELARKRKEFEDMKKRVEKVHNKFRQRMQ